MSASGKQNISKTSQVVRACERLEKAVARLDQAVLNIPKTSAGGDSGEQAGQITALKAQNAELQEITRTVSGRLDQTIGNLKAVLES